MHHQVTHDVRCSDADTTNQCLSRVKDASILSWPTNYNGSLEAVDCHLHSVRYDMAFKRGAGGRLRCIIRSPTTL
eukprot:scaffold3601_cov83-Skeletonema_dohrnii-CCMP3373.AAC.1